MFQSQITPEESQRAGAAEYVARQKAAQKRFRDIVKQRWQEEKIKTLSKKAYKKLKPTENPEPELMALAEDAGGSFRMRYSKGLWYLHFTFLGKKVESSAPTLSEAINRLIINKHLK